MSGRQRSRSSFVGDNMLPSINTSFAWSRSSNRKGSSLLSPKTPGAESPFQDDEDLMKRLFERFTYMSASDRRNTVITLIKLCDNHDLSYFSYKIPRLNRDFLALLPAEINYRILTYIYPRDLCTLVCVSKTWAKLAKDIKAWEAIYSKLGLLEMASQCYIPEFPMIDNAKRLYTLRNWAKGVFTLKYIRAHPLGILCIAFDGKYIAVRKLFENIDWKC